MERPLSRDGSPPAGRRPEPELSNPPVAEGINVSDKRPLRTFFVNLAITGAGLLALVVLLEFTASLFAPLVPFGWERGLIGESLLSSRLDAKGEARQEALRRLADKVAAGVELPEGMTVTVHYNPGGTVNAFATLGGNIVVYQGLLERLESEDGLTMVLAHEMAHIKNRDAIRGVLKAMGLVLLFTGVHDSGAYARQVLDIGMAGYSRAQEEAADAEAVRALGKLYGHAGGAGEFFRALARMEERDPDGDPGKKPFSALLGSHPDTLERLAKARQAASEGGFPADGAMTPLSPALADG